MAAFTKFGVRLAEKRRAAGLTQEQLGAGLALNGSDVGKGAVSSWEVGRTMPSPALLPKLCARLGCSSDDLLGIASRRRKQKAEA